MTSVRVLAVLATLAFAAASCGGPDAESTGVVNRELEIEALNDEIDEVMTWMRRAEDVYISRCMREEGFSFPEEVPALPTVRSTIFPVDLDEWDAKSDGYFGEAHRLLEAESEAILAESQAHLLELSDEELKAYDQALMGSGARVEIAMPDGAVLSAPADGCLAAARSWVQGQSDPDTAARLGALASTISGLSLELSSLVEADERYLDVIDEWSGCMAAEGYVFESPSAARETGVNDRPIDAEQPTAEEVKQAVSDKECQAQIGLQASVRVIAVDLEAEILSRPEYEGLVLEWHEVAGPSQARAQEILADAGLDSGS